MLKMKVGRLMHELREFVDSKGKVRPCEIEVLKGTNNLPIKSRICSSCVIIKHEC